MECPVLPGHYTTVYLARPVIVQQLIIIMVVMVMIMMMVRVMVMVVMAGTRLALGAQVALALIISGSLLLDIGGLLGACGVVGVVFLLANIMAKVGATQGTGDFGGSPATASANLAADRAASSPAKDRADLGIRHFKGRSGRCCADHRYAQYNSCKKFIHSCLPETQFVHQPVAVWL